MSVPKPIAALAAGCLMLGAAALAQTGGTAPRSEGDQAVQTLVIENETPPIITDWIERSDVAALRDGVIERMELQIGMPVKKGGTIGILHHEMAELTVKKNKLQAEAIAPKKKAEAQFYVAGSKVARDKRLNERKPGMVSDEEAAEHEGELRVADAARREADENQTIAKAELDLAQQALTEHTIVAPFDGVIIKRMKNPGESVNAKEAVVSLGNPNKLCVNAYVGIDHAFRVKEGQVVEIQPSIRHGKGEPLPIEKKRLRGKITFIDPHIQAVGEIRFRIRAEFENSGELRPGLPVRLTIFLNDAPAATANNDDSTSTTTRTR